MKKHALSAAVLLALALVPATALAQDDGTWTGSVDETIDSEAQALKQIEELTRQALSSGEIPITEMPARMGHGWGADYDSVAEFESNDTLTRSFISAQLAGDEWNRINAEHHLRIYNFETIIGNLGHGHEMTLLVTELQKMQDRYDASGPAKKFHEWLADKYDVPESENGITARMLEIVGDEKFLDLAEKTASSFDALVENASPPIELYDSDDRYWMLTTWAYLCEFTPTCDSASFKDYRDGKKSSTGVANDVDGKDVWKHILPSAYAASRTYVPYGISLQVVAASCDMSYHMCSIVGGKAISSGYGKIEFKGLSVTNPDGSKGANIHTYGPHLILRGSACVNKTPDNTYDGLRNNVRVTPFIDNAFQNDGSAGGRPSEDERCAQVNTTYDTRRNVWSPFGGKAESTGSYYIR